MRSFVRSHFTDGVAVIAVLLGENGVSARRQDEKVANHDDDVVVIKERFESKQASKRAIKDFCLLECVRMTRVVMIICGTCCCRSRRLVQ